MKNEQKTPGVTMSQDDERNKNFLPLQGEGNDDSGTAGGGSAGGQGGKIEFREFIKSSEALRDDLLSNEEKRRLLFVHEKQHEGVVIKQKSFVEERKRLKSGKISLAAHREGRGLGNRQSQFKSHPISAKAQFSGIDKQVIGLPDENMAKTNDEKRNELVLRHRLTNQPQNVPQFNPKPLQK